MAHFLRFKVTYYHHHPSVTHATITSSPPSSSRLYTPISPFYHLHSICQRSLSTTAYLTIPPVTFFHVFSETPRSVSELPFPFRKLVPIPHDLIPGYRRVIYGRSATECSFSELSALPVTA